jgi:hypothetical protein
MHLTDADKSVSKEAIDWMEETLFLQAKELFQGLKNKWNF